VLVVPLRLPRLAAATAVSLLALLPCSAPLPPWQSFTLTEGGLLSLGEAAAGDTYPHPPAVPGPPPVPAEWYVADLAWADSTNDGFPEWALLVWRPWRDWEIQRWSSVPSPIIDFHDEQGLSCHVVLIASTGDREIWAGSALPVPLLTLEVGDVDGDGRNELVTLEGNYAAGWRGAATHLVVWRWSGFGFSLEERSPAAGYHQARLTDCNNDGILDIVVR
jgi:hypothetical protein